MTQVPQAAPLFQKDPKAEAFLDRLNRHLAPHQEAEYADHPEAYPTLFIIGTPRSGTTLLYQLISTYLDVGYINNLAASFWQAPVYGIRLSQKLIQEPKPSSFTSEFGRTHGLHEPHEFGYFWSAALNNKALRYPTPEERASIDWGRLKYLLTNMAHAFAKPACYKVSIMGWHVERLLTLMRRACFVHIRRDPTDVAVSLLRFRMNMRGSLDQWISLKPASYASLKNEPYWVQVAGQAFHLEEEMSKQLRRADPERTLEVTYADLCTQPGTVLLKVQALLEHTGYRPDILFIPPPSFPYTTYSPQRHPDYNRVAEAMLRFQHS